MASNPLINANRDPEDLRRWFLPVTNAQLSAQVPTARANNPPQVSSVSIPSLQTRLSYSPPLCEPVRDVFPATMETKPRAGLHPWPLVGWYSDRFRTHAIVMDHKGYKRPFSEAKRRGGRYRCCWDGRTLVLKSGPLRDPYYSRKPKSRIQSRKRARGGRIKRLRVAGATKPRSHMVPVTKSLRQQVLKF
jgi:hypothetical protein